jgi:Trypsin-co-occurring domain 1
MASDIAQVVLPSGDPVWVRLEMHDGGLAGVGPEDVGLRDAAGSVLDGAQLPGFAETVRGVVASVRQVLDEHRPDSFEVEFGIEIAAQTGKVLSVLAEARGTAHVRVTASWSATSPGPTPGSRARAVDAG